MTFFDETKSILENITFLVQPFLFVIAIIGLWQIKIAKDSIKITSQRESATMSITLCEKYFDEMYKIADEVATKMKKEKLDVKKLINLNLKNLEKLDSDMDNYDEYLKLKDKYHIVEHDLYRLAVKLEIFSMPFTQKIADESLAYKLIFPAYYEFCCLCAIEFEDARIRKPEETILYQSIFELYSLWKQRNDNEKIDHQVKTLLKNKKDDKILSPIGTK